MNKGRKTLRENFYHGAVRPDPEGKPSSSTDRRDLVQLLQPFKVNQRIGLSYLHLYKSEIFLDGELQHLDSTFEVDRLYFTGPHF